MRVGSHFGVVYNSKKAAMTGLDNCAMHCEVYYPLLLQCSSHSFPPFQARSSWVLKDNLLTYAAFDISLAVPALVFQVSILPTKVFRFRTEDGQDR